MSDLVKRLYDTPLYEGSGEASELGEEAADEITSLTARVKELEEALSRIARMKQEPNDAMNRMALLAASAIARAALKDMERT